jgi:type I restriction enzyme S subunit
MSLTKKKKLRDRPIFSPLPFLAEQQKIADILSTVDEKLDILREKKETYQTLKKGLMQQLLTGALRVTHVHLNPETRA